jgi:hypothetical protein
MRYLDKVTEVTQKFMDNKISQNYFTGEKAVPLEATLGEVETLFSASPDVQALAENGKLNGLHEKCTLFSEQSEIQYISIKDKIENIVKATEAKESEINAELTEDYEVALMWDGYSVENLKTLKDAIAKSGDPTALQDLHNQLVALQGVKAKAYASLSDLQAAYE